MQLFITNFDIKNNQIYIKEEKNYHQLKNVLRFKKGNIFQIQDFNLDNVIRYTINFDEFKDNIVIGTILEKQIKKIINKWGMIIALLNKFEKIELIVQKLSEIGIDEIIFWQSKRSILKNISEQKLERLKKISIEAVEQSKGWVLPNIQIIKNLNNFIKDKKIILFDINGEEINLEKNKLIGKKNNLYGIIGPEGGFDKNELKDLEKLSLGKINLGENILRAETASIIGGWLIKNSFDF